MDGETPSSNAAVTNMNTNIEGKVVVITHHDTSSHHEGCRHAHWHPRFGIDGR
jgi:hypothetical protein